MGNTKRHAHGHVYIHMHKHVHSACAQAYWQVHSMLAAQLYWMRRETDDGLELGTSAIAASEWRMNVRTCVYRRCCHN